MEGACIMDKKAVYEVIDSKASEFAALSEDLRAVIARLQETLADVQVVFDETENAFDDLELPTAD